MNVAVAYWSSAILARRQRRVRMRREGRSGAVGWASNSVLGDQALENNDRSHPAAGFVRARPMARLKTHRRRADERPH